MSPENDVVRLVDGVLRRARILGAAESAAVGAFVAAASVRAGLIVAVAFAIWRARRITRQSVLRSLERHDPRSRNLIVTADELAQGTLTASDEMRPRVMRDAVSVVATIDRRRVISARRAGWMFGAAIAAWVFTALWAGLRDRPSMRLSMTSRTGAAAGPSQPRASIDVRITIEPPPYTRREPVTLVNAADVQAVEGSRMTIAVAGEGPVVLDVTGETLEMSRDASGAYVSAAVATKSGYILATSKRNRRLTTLTVTPDALPAVVVKAPGRDLVYADNEPVVAFEVHATDDFGLRALRLRFTRVSGSGEQFDFVDGEIPLAVSKRSAREWTGSASRPLRELGLAEGDVLVYRAVAADERGGAGEADSDAFFIEISKLGVAAGDAFTLPEHETRYALSQQMLIVKTDRLNARRSSLGDREFVEASQNLAIEQRMIRSEFVFMLGGEIEDEEAEAEQSVELQAGRLANRGQRDLREATVAMSQAEKLLTGANTSGALRAEREAVAALQRAFSRDRYILRALATRSQLDAGRRLTGVMSRAPGWRRHLVDAPENRRAIGLQSLLQGLGDPDLAAPQLSVLAGLAIRIDVESPLLRQVGGDLQRLADRFTSLPAADRQRALDDIAGRISAEARRALGGAPAAVDTPR